MAELHLRQLGFTYGACEPCNQNKERIQKFKETGDLRYIYQSKLDKTYFQHDMAYGEFKDLPRTTAADKVLHVKVIQNIMDINADLIQWFINFSIKSLLVVVLEVELCQTKN